MVKFFNFKSLPAAFVAGCLFTTDVVSACDQSCYDDVGPLWTEKCARTECADCGPCNYQEPGESDLRSPCPAFNVLANHGVINRAGTCINAQDVALKFQEYFGCQYETAMLVITQVATFSAIQGNPIDLNCFNLSDIFNNVKQTSWINDDTTKLFQSSKFEQLAAKASPAGKINNWDLLEHQKKVVIQSRCKGRWQNELYESIFGPRLGFPGDNPFMFNFAGPTDWAVKYFGVTPGSGTPLPYMNLDIEELRSVFELNKFPDTYVQRKCPQNPDDCFGQAFGSVLDPFLVNLTSTGRPFWTDEQIALYNALYPEPEFSLISEHIVKELNYVVYKELSEEDCAEDYYDENPDDDDDDDDEEEECDGIICRTRAFICRIRPFCNRDEE